MEPECDNCWAEHKRSRAAVTLADSLKLCVDCWMELKDDCEPVEPSGV